MLPDVRGHISRSQPDQINLAYLGAWNGVPRKLISRRLPAIKVHRRSLSSKTLGAPLHTPGGPRRSVLGNRHNLAVPAASDDVDRDSSRFKLECFFRVASQS